MRMRCRLFTLFLWYTAAWPLYHSATISFRCPFSPSDLVPFSCFGLDALRLRCHSSPSNFMPSISDTLPIHSLFRLIYPSSPSKPSPPSPSSLYRLFRPYALGLFRLFLFRHLLFYYFIFRYFILLLRYPSSPSPSSLSPSSSFPSPSSPLSLCSSSPSDLTASRTHPPFAVGRLQVISI